MDSDARIGEARQRAGTAYEPDVAGGLVRVVRARDVRRRAGRRRVVRGLLLVAVVATVVVALLAGWQAERPPGRTVDPLTPSRSPVNGSPLMLTRTLVADSLGLERLLSVAVAPNGNLYVTDASQTVSEVTPRGRVIRSWGGPGTAPGRFRMVTGAVAVGHDGRVYVADTGNFRVQVFSPDGAFLDSWGTFGGGPGHFLWPADVAVDGRGGVYVADDRAATITRLSGSGRQDWRSGDPRTTPEELVGYAHFTQVDVDGNLVLANEDTGLVVSLDAQGHEVDAFGSSSSGRHDSSTPGGAGLFPEGACDASVDTRGWVYVTSCGAATDPDHTTRVFDTAGNLTGVWRDNPLSRSPCFGPDGRTAWAVGSDGSLLRLAILD